MNIENLNQVRALVKSHGLRKLKKYLSTMISGGNEDADIYFELGNLYHTRGNWSRNKKL